MAEVQIIGLPQSNWVWATRIACAEKGVSHENIVAEPHSRPIDAIHPLGKVPVMRHGDFVLAESRAICMYIDRAFQGPALTPAGIQEAAIAEMWASIIQTSVEPIAIRQYLFGYMIPKTADKSPDRAQIDAAMPQVAKGLSVVAKGIEDGALGSGHLTIGDAFLIPILFYLKNTPEAGKVIGASKTLSGYFDRQIARPSVKQTMPPLGAQS